LRYFASSIASCEALRAPDSLMSLVTIDDVLGALRVLRAIGSRRSRDRPAKAAAYILARPHETSRDRLEVTRDHIVQRYGGLCLFTALLILSGAVSGIMSMAQSAAVLATSMYQAGASALPVR
jgi:hypothetical protein